MSERAIRFGGPKECESHCSECGPMASAVAGEAEPLVRHLAMHHFNESQVAFADDEGQEDAEPAKLGIECWYDCLHCPTAWVEDLPDEDLMHPNGRCTCVGEGTCDWCRTYGQPL